LWTGKQTDNHDIPSARVTML